MTAVVRFTACVISIFLVAGLSEAKADCAMPNGSAGAITWNGADAVIWCDGSTWHSLADIGNGTIANAKLASMAANTVKGNNTGASIAPTDLTMAQLRAILGAGTPSSSTYLRGDGTWAATGGIPVGAIMAFDLTICPSGWSEYTAARGRFLRGIDNGAGVDPDGTRAPGNTQADELKSHSHTYNLAKGRDANPSPPHVRFGYATDNLNQYNSVAGAINSTGGSETRPTNVAVLFCRKD